jgi:hypothetical protein
LVAGLLIAGGDWKLWTITGGANVVILLAYFLKVGLQWLWRRCSASTADSDDESRRIIN